MKEWKDITVMKANASPTKEEIIIKPSSPAIDIPSSNLSPKDQEASKWMGQAATASNVKRRALTPTLPVMGIVKSRSGSQMFSSGMTSRLPNQKITVTGLFGRRMKRK